MRDPNDDDIDRAYRAGVDAIEDSAARQRRRAAVLKAVQGSAAAEVSQAHRQDLPQVTAPDVRNAANQARWHRSNAWWRGAAAACVIVSSALVVLHLREGPGFTTGSGLRRDAEPAAPPSAKAQPAPAATAAKAAAAQAPARKAAEAAPLPALVTGGATSAPVAKAARSTLPDSDNEVSNATGRVGDAAADATAPDAVPRPAVAAPMAPDQASTLSTPERLEPPAPRIDGRSATGRTPLAGTTVAPESTARNATADAVAKASPLGATAGQLAGAAAQTPRRTLLIAVTRGDIAATRQILRTTDPDAERDAEGRTPLAIAVLRSNVPLVKLLLASGANRDAPDRFEQTPLGYAEASGDPAMLQAFGRP